MIKYDFIEEVGQHYYQCIIEIYFMEMVQFDFSYHGIDTFNIVLANKPVERITGRIVHIPADKNRIFNFMMS
jgi:hypothetical protein